MDPAILVGPSHSLFDAMIHMTSDPRRDSDNSRNVTNNKNFSQTTTGDHTQPIQVSGGEVTVNNNQQTVNNNSCSPLVRVAIVGYIVGYIVGNCTMVFFRKGNSCNCCSTIIYNEAKTAVLKLSVIKQIGLAVAGVIIAGVIIPGAIIGAGVSVGFAAGFLLPGNGNYLYDMFI